jgi:spermidine/putrescine transport system ATP-binding protein
MTNGFAVELRQVSKKFGQVTAVDQVNLQIQDGEFFSLLGPSGCGKTTSLRMIAGFEMPTNGQVFIEGEPQGYLPPYQRPVNTVFQHYALFPHMTVYQNVAFGLEMQKVDKTEVKQRVGEALEMVHLLGMENRRPKQLSGGQQQRVALARALVNRPKVLLLDEPLGALDLKLRKAMQVELKTLQDQVGITFIYVTHDQEEALAMSDRIAVMNLGKVHQLGTPEEIYEAPANRFVADFIGESNFIPGSIQQMGPPTEVSISETEQLITAEWIEEGLNQDDRVVISVRPEKIRIHPRGEAPGFPAMCCVSGQVEKVIYLGTDTRYLVRLNAESAVVVRLQNIISGGGHFNEGDLVDIRWDSAHARVFKE